MKKTVFLLSAALMLLTTVNANNTVNATEVANDVTFVTPMVKKVGPFCMAIVKNDLPAVKRMIELGADINKTSNSLTPIMYAAKYNRVEILKLLIQEGADLKRKCSKGNTALKYAELSSADEAATLIKKAMEKKKRRKK